MFIYSGYNYPNSMNCFTNYLFLPVTHRSRNTWNGVGGGGGGGGWIHPQVLLKYGFSTDADYLETPKFVVTTNWLQLNVLLYRNHVVTTKYLLPYRNPIVENFTTNLTSS